MTNIQLLVDNTPHCQTLKSCMSTAYQLWVAVNPGGSFTCSLKHWESIDQIEQVETSGWGLIRAAQTCAFNNYTNGLSQ